MSSPTVLVELQKLENSSLVGPEKSLAYESILEKIVNDPRPDDLAHNLSAFVNSILGESLGIIAARPLLSSFVNALQRLTNPAIKINAGMYSLDALQSRVVSFEEQDALIRDIVANAYQEQEEFVEAAKILQGIQLDSSQRKILDDDKVRIWIRICRLYLEEDDTTSAEAYLNRAKPLLHKVEDKELTLLFQLSQARILDSRRKFLDASQMYHNVSLSLALAEEERTMALSQAIICAILAPAGPQRSRSLGKLFKDERATHVEEYGILEKMFLDRLISPEEIAKFAKKLAPHHLALTADGSTVLAKAVIEHNLLGASRLYSNISFIELGILLGLDASKAEEYGAGMLEQGRLVGSIDQMAGMIFFGIQEATGEDAVMAPAKLTGKMGSRRWDRNIRGLTEEVERVSSLLQARYPLLAIANSVH